MNHKSDVTACFRLLLQEAATLPDFHVKVLHSDGGGEFDCKAMDTFCKANGIRQQFSPPYTPQRNGISERVGRTLQDSTRAMLASSGLAKDFWGAAMLHAALIKNVIPHSTTGAISWNEVTGHSFDYDLLKPFGVDAFVHVSVGKRPRGRPQMLEVEVNYTEPAQQQPALQEPQPQPQPQQQPEPHLDLDIPPTPTPLTPPPAPRVEGEKRVQPPRAAKGGRSYVFVATSLANREPDSLEEALSSPAWTAALQDEIRSLEENNTWTVLPRSEVPPSSKVLPTQLLWKLKLKANGEPDRYKARFVVGGHRQREGIDYNEVFAPKLGMVALRSILSNAAAHGHHIHNLDVNAAFLYADITEEVYIELPPTVTSKN